MSIFVAIKKISMQISCTFLVFFLITTFLSCNGAAQDNVPKRVSKEFKSKYPKENDPDWRVDKNGNYEAHFKKKGIHYRADFSPKGDWIETETNIKKKALPKAIRKILDSEYKDVKIYEIEKVSHFSKGTFYDVELKIDGRKQDIEFKKDGSIINN